MRAKCAGFAPRCVKPSMPWPITGSHQVETAGLTHASNDNPWLANYHPAPGAADELVLPEGAIRQVWAPLLQELVQLGEEGLQRAIGRGDRYLHDAGVYYRQYGEEAARERDWPLSAIPVLIAESEWREVAAGLRQRAELLERVAKDLYGTAGLVANGHLPATVVAQNREWLRPMVGLPPKGGHYLHFVAFDLGRGPDGNWWVLADRTQAPSGAGFALENRVATSRIFTSLYKDLGVHRLASFFAQFRDMGLALSGQGPRRAGVLTPGPGNDTYYEHAYIARYLGMSLLEGEDLVVRNGQAMVRTIAGPEPIDVLWRRLDAGFADPLELDETSRIGTPGLVSAVRKGRLALINALGTGVLEARAMLAFMPRLSEVLLGEQLRLPNIATWWCGSQQARDHVLANAQNMIVGSALSSRLPFTLDDVAAVAGDMRGATTHSLESWLAEEGSGLVGQEAVTLSTTPALEDGQLVPRPMSLRAYAVRTPEGWQVLNGGFARVGLSSDPLAVAMQAGARAADVWIVPDGVKPESQAAQDQNQSEIRHQPGALPARAADNLYWLGRYVERAEAIMRLTRAYHARRAELNMADEPLLVALAEYMGGYRASPGPWVPLGLVETLDLARASAMQTRDRFSVDGWSALRELCELAHDGQPVLEGDEVAERMSALLRRVAGFSGLVHENMERLSGWRFLSLGRALERAQMLCELIQRFADPKAPEGGLDLIVEIGDSVMTHRRRLGLTTSRDTVIELMVHDEMNPRSLARQVTQISRHLRQLPAPARPRDADRIEQRLEVIARLLAPREELKMKTTDLDGVRRELLILADDVLDAYVR